MQKIDITPHEDSRLLPCPICGKQAYWRRIRLSSGFNRTGIAPENATITEEKVTMSGEKLYQWERHGYAIHCLTKKCRCRTPLTGKIGLEEAISEWNTKRISS